MTAASVLVAIELGEDFELTLREASTYTDPGEVLVACHVLPEIGQTRPHLPRVSAANAVERVALDRMVRQHIEDVARLAGIGPLEIVLESGEPYARVIDVTQRCGPKLLVTGEPSSTDGWFAGTAEQLVRYAPCPTLVARGERSGPVLVGTDLSDPSLPAIRMGAELARRRGVGLVVLHVIDLPRAWATLSAIAAAVAATVAPPADEGSLRRAAEETLRATVATEAPGAAAEVEVGRPHQVIVRRSEERGAGLIVVGTRGRTGLGRAMIGSVAEAVVRTATCSVLVVRHGTSPKVAPR